MTLEEKWQAVFTPHPLDPDALVGTSRIYACALAAVQALHQQIYAECVRRTFRIVRGGTERMRPRERR